MKTLELNHVAIHVDPAHCGGDVDMRNDSIVGLRHQFGEGRRCVGKDDACIIGVCHNCHPRPSILDIGGCETVNRDSAFASATDLQAPTARGALHF